MQSSNGLWQLSFEELAQKCRQLAQSSPTGVDPSLQEEARRIYGGWTSAFSIDKHENDAGERVAAATTSLRKRTIELLLKAEPEA